MNPDHLLEQAVSVLSLDRNGRPRQADINRSISTVYYAVFHYLLKRGSNRFARQNAPWPLYVRIYRSVDHAAVRRACVEAVRTGVISGYAGDIDSGLRAGCATMQRLADARISADYDPSYRPSLEQARQLVEDARLAIASFEAAPSAQFDLMLAQMVFPRPRN